MPQRVTMLGERRFMDFRIDDDYEVRQSWAIEWIDDKEKRDRAILRIIAEYIYEIYGDLDEFAFDYAEEDLKTRDQDSWGELEEEEAIAWMVFKGKDYLLQSIGYSYRDWEVTPASAFMSCGGVRVVKQKR